MFGFRVRIFFRKIQLATHDPMKNTALLQVAGALLLSLCLSPATLMAADAAKVDFVVGEVVAIQADGTRRQLARGAGVGVAETVDTGSGRAQLRFTDGAMVSLQPQTQFRVDAYEFKGGADDSEKGFFSLLKGAMRTITGAIGKANRQAYRLDTPVATNRIRGHDYELLTLLRKLARPEVPPIGITKRMKHRRRKVRPKPAQAAKHHVSSKNVLSPFSLPQPA